MIVDTRPVRRIGKRSNQVKFRKQPDGPLFSVAMSPTNSEDDTISGSEDYELKCTKRAEVTYLQYLEPIERDRRTENISKMIGIKILFSSARFSFRF
jgi:hypothetical protein